jgi:hypothetical protein
VQPLLSDFSSANVCAQRHYFECVLITGKTNFSDTGFVLTRANSRIHACDGRCYMKIIRAGRFIENFDVSIPFASAREPNVELRGRSSLTKPARSVSHTGKDSIGH